MTSDNGRFATYQYGLVQTYSLANTGPERGMEVIYGGNSAFNFGLHLLSLSKPLQAFLSGPEIPVQQLRKQYRRISFCQSS